MNLLDPIKKIVIDRRDYLMNRAVLGEAFDGLLKYLSLKEKTVMPVVSGGTSLTGPYANGQLLIGNGTGLTANTLTPGSGIVITNGPGSITISATPALLEDPIPKILMLMGG